MGFSLRDLTRQFSAISSSVNATAVGVDIGSSTIKAVQVRREDSTIILESYGEMDLSRYESPSGDGVTPAHVAEALLNLMHEVKISSHTVGVSVLSSSTLIAIINMPSRDEEQLARLVPSEAQKYIPMSIKDVFLDWRVIPDPSVHNNVFDTMNTGPSVVPTRQRILLAAIYKQTVETYEKIIKQANLSASFYEIEASSAARSAIEKILEPVLMMDLGAKTSKLSIVEREIVMVLHSVTKGGADLTRALMEDMHWDQVRAESVKRERGLAPSAGSNTEESKEITRALTTVLETIVSEAQSLIETYREQQKEKVAKVVLIGGGARLPGIEDYLKARLQISVEIARPFNRTRYPVVLEGNLNDAGAVFANAIGLALRAVG